LFPVLSHLRSAASAADAFKPARTAYVSHIYALFNESLDGCLASITREHGNASELFGKLRAAGIRVAVGSGFPRHVVHAIARNLKWLAAAEGDKHGARVVDYIGSADDVGGKSRPDPAMILHAMHELGIRDPRAVLKVGDTAVDVQEGKNAGCWTAAVLTGTQTRDTLAKQKPDFIFDSIADLPTILPQLKQTQPARAKL
jgi:phosphoglycolate phosphatase-like HAD superfamily hydrolase